jgi:hypothetical protein
VLKRLERIIDTIETAYSQSFPGIAEQLANITMTGTQRRFVVTRMGSTGSTWLAWLLNSHPDVQCSHEAILSRIFPKDSYNSNDLVDLIRLLAFDAHHGAYLASGDVGSVWPPHIVALESKFATGLLIRHPARTLNTRLHVFPDDRSFSEIPRWTKQAIRELWDIDVNKLAPLDQIFLNDILVFAGQIVLRGKVGMILRIEDLQDMEYCRHSLAQLTGVKYPVSLIARAIRRRINSRTGVLRPIKEIVKGFGSQREHWYRTLLRDVAPLFDYDLECDATVPHRPLMGVAV